MASRTGATRSLVLLALGYVAMVVVVTALLIYARRSALANLSTQQSISQWQTWREEARERGDRREPKSPEPPGLVLMRDYFAVCLAGAILFTSLLYWVLAWFVTGMLRTGRSPTT